MHAHLILSSCCLKKRYHFMRSYVREYIINEGFWVTSILVGCKMYGIKAFEVIESKTSFIGGWSL